MTHPDDITAYLQARLEDRNPKCASCRHWNRDLEHPTFGVCMRYPMATVSRFERPDPGLVLALGGTTDLSVCSAWEKRDAQS